MSYNTPKADKVTTNFIGSIKCYQCGKKIFDKRDVWDRLTYALNLDTNNALDTPGKPVKLGIDDTTRNDIHTLFYESVVNAIYPPANCKGIYKDISVYKITINKDIPILCTEDNDIIHINELRFYIFPYDIAFFAINASWEDIPLDKLNEYNRIIRNVEHYYHNHISHQFLAILQPVIAIYNASNKAHHIAAEDFQQETIKDYIKILYKTNKLKCYMIIRINEETLTTFSPQYTRDNLLYDIATMSDIGSSTDPQNAYKPSQRYYEHLMEHNKIDCYENWTALALVDTFCCLMNPFTENKYDYQYNDMWGNLYFDHLYINTLYIKAFMLSTIDNFNTGKNQTKYNKEFDNFDYRFNHYNVSYNFLPDLIYKTLRTGMEIDNELYAIKNQINTHNNKIEQKQNTRLNWIMALLAILTTASILNDGWEFILKLLSFS